MNKGFTLIELTIAMTVLTVITAVVLVGTSSDAKERRALQNVASTLQADMQYAQRRAITEGRRVEIHFEPQSNRYYIMSFEPTIQVFRTVNFSDSVELIASSYQGNSLTYLPRGTGNAGRVSMKNGRHLLEITTTVSGAQSRIHTITTE
jgi:prepilin-type N-terminal cleavage/methylation domain-containing protein